MAYFGLVPGERSSAGVGRIVLATLLAEAFDALQRRDYAALRSLTGVAPVTKPC